MKTVRLILAGVAMVAAFAACNKTPEPTPDGSKDPSSDVNPGGSTDPEESTDPEAPKSSECKLTDFTIHAGELELEGFVDPTDKTIEIAYMPNEYLFLSAATAEVVISDKATIAPDPTQPIDYTVDGGVKFTVTAEDGETTSEYLVYLAAAEFSESVSLKWSKKYGEMGITPRPDAGGDGANHCCIGFADRNHFAIADGSVYDLDGNPAGSLNIDGVPSLDFYGGQFFVLSNDENGVLVAVACYNGVNGEGADVVYSAFYAWKDGWDKAPTLIYGPVDYQCQYMSVAGDVTGDFILNFRTGANAPQQMHHVLVFKNGVYFKDDGSSAATWYGPMINHPGNDGIWGQMLSFFSGDPEEGFVCWDSLGAAEMGETGNASAGFYVYAGLSEYVSGNTDEIYILRGQVNWVNWDADGRWYGYGNYSTGHVRAFKYNGTKYIIAASSSWPCTWITIQKAEDIVLDDEETDEVDESLANYLLPTDIILETPSCRPCSAYVYDPATGTGHVVYVAQSTSVVAYDIATDRL